MLVKLKTREALQPQKCETTRWVGLFTDDAYFCSARRRDTIEVEVESRVVEATTAISCSSSVAITYLLGPVPAANHTAKGASSFCTAQIQRRRQRTTVV